ncbi:hypothetical protein [Ferribacterium limneticum]|uniref:hypothetical protein n=1 Tax=Ferribacterium limneticum TaxID=76259 RepID=UPI001CF80A6A|nr:hypothetical protein [Ferribacterium limneticum]UCV26741.1 hypothetical protein KI617_10510 [Ferribacterium limneticum]UCV30658.1 hypothetical protein KI608_10510 [Ferribacterium limneticum]
MSEAIECMKAMNQARKDARTQRRENTPDLLDQAGVLFTEHNEGAHLVVESHLGYIDFWPGTGRWKTRTLPQHTGFTVTKLLALIKPEFTH